MDVACLLQEQKSQEKQRKEGSPSSSCVEALQCIAFRVLGSSIASSIVVWAFERMIYLALGSLIKIMLEAAGYTGEE